MMKATVRFALRNLVLAIALSSAVLVPLALASCANSTQKTQESYEDRDMPKGDGHEGHSH